MVRSRPPRRSARWLRPLDSGKRSRRTQRELSFGWNAGRQNLPSFLFPRLGLRAARSLTRSGPHKAKEMFMHSGVVCQFRMEGGCQNIVPLHQCGLPGVLRENLQARPGPFNNRAANENHFERLLLQFCWAADNVAGNLAPVPISQHRHVQKFQGILPGILDFCSEQNRTGARPENCSTLLREFLDRLRQAFFLQKLQLRGALATWKNQAVAALEIAGSAYFNGLYTQPRHHCRLAFNISLHCQNSNFQFPAPTLFPSGAPSSFASRMNSSSRIVVSFFIWLTIARMCRTASTTFPEPASPFVRIIAAPSPMRRSASPRLRAPQTNGTR